MKRFFHIAFQALLLQVILLTLSYLSYQLGTVTNSLLLYLPLVLGIVFIHWFGWRILPVLFINGMTTLMIWGVTNFTIRTTILSTHEAIVALSSLFLFTKGFSEQRFSYFNNTHSFLRFILLGIIVPVCINSVYVYHYGFVRGNLDTVALYWLSDFITILPVSMVLLYFITYKKENGTIPLQFNRTTLTKKVFGEIGIICIVFIALSLLFPFDKYWFIYGIGATLFALRWGFEAAIILNGIIFMLNYMLPLFDFASSLLVTRGSTQYVSVHLGMSTMMFVSMLVGRVVSDLGIAEGNLKKEKKRVEDINDELKQANEELDRFVYSVSHDLSAPLKSIKGLITISRMEPQLTSQYIDKIDKSVDRLEEFIGEVLDYSRTNRKQLTFEEINLQNFIEDINHKFEFLENFDKIKFKYILALQIIISDPFLLRVILGNLISNAIKYQKRFGSHDPSITIQSYCEGEFTVLQIVDNGEGIKTEYQDKLFNMFYRGTVSSSGSGLGLYIAKEAIQKLNGKIVVKSIWGEGSVFSIYLPTVKK